jgi:hypothetical protein
MSQFNKRFGEKDDDDEPTDDKPAAPAKPAEETEKISEKTSALKTGCGGVTWHYALNKM